MRELTKGQSNAMRRHCKELELSRKALEQAAERWNDAQQAAYEFASGVYDELREHFEEKSEKWQTSEVGRRFSEWMNPWAEARDAVHEDIELPDFDTFMDAFYNVTDEVDDI